jgi:hypothetical protein
MSATIKFLPMLLLGAELPLNAELLLGTEDVELRPNLKPLKAKTNKKA